MSLENVSRNTPKTPVENGSQAGADGGSPMSAPVPRKKPTTRSFHGREFVDNYEWMRDKESEELLAHLKAENEWTEHRTAHLDGLKKDIFEEIKARVQETDLSVPIRSGQWWYFSRTEEGKNYPSMCRIPVHDVDDWTPPVIEPGVAMEDEQVFLDANAMAEGADFFSLGAASVTLDGKRLAYSVDNAGDERFTMRFKDLTTGEHWPEEISDISYGATWVGNETVYYQRVDEVWRPHEIWKHTVGTPTEQDELVFREDDERYWTGVGTTRSERYLLVYTSSKVTSECWYLDLQDPNAELTCILPREDSIEYGVDHAVVDGRDYWLVIHNRNGVNSELGYHPVGTISSLADVVSLVPHRDDARVEGVDVFRNYLVLELRENAVETAHLMDIRHGFSEFQPIEFDEDLISVAVTGNTEWESPVLRVAVSSFVRPARVFDIDLETGEKILRKEQIVLPAPDGTPFTPGDYVARRLWVTARDGAKVPVSLVYRSDLDLTHPNPTLLYGYGSYEISRDPAFLTGRLPLLDRGGIFAIAHVRGGGEMGRAWYDDGKQLKKMNTFTDFIDVADHLIETGVTTAETMVAEGGSAGGMLMGAIANMAPDRFSGVQAVVPFVDPLTSMLMPELPLTVTEWDEWGDPYHDPKVYDYMAGYAPYENIDPNTDYPAILAITSLNDTRVLYVEPAKWVAKLRDVAGADAMMRIDMVSGHGGVSGRYEQWKQLAFETAWELEHMGLA